MIAELNGAVDIRPSYALDEENVYAEGVLELLRTATRPAHARRELTQEVRLVVDEVNRDVDRRLTETA